MTAFPDFLKDAGAPVSAVDTATPRGASQAPHRAELSRHGQIPGREELSENDRQFVSDIRDLETYDKIQLVNAYVNGRIQFEEQAYGAPQDTRGYNEIMKTPKGDCDDYAYAKAVLLHHAGVENVNVVGVDMQFHFNEGKSATFAHAFTVAGTPDGKYYALDNLVEEPYEIGRDLRSAQDNLHLPDNADNGPARAEIHKVLGVSSLDQDGREQYYAPAELKPESPKPPEQQPQPFRPSAMGLNM